MNIKKLYSDGKARAMTLSYDDGIEQDKRFVGILNKYGLKCTFNQNSALLVKRDSWTHESGTVITRMDPAELPKLYSGHENAMHMAHHPFPTKISDDELVRETVSDRDFLSDLFGYDVSGMAYPFGDYNDHVIDVLKKLGVKYSRTVKSTFGFALPQEWLAWHPTVHHIESQMEPLLDEFLTCDDELALYYLWGHSYEFDVDDDWDRIEKFCAAASGKADVYYATNMEIYNYINAVGRLVVTESGAYNPSEIPIWVSVDGKTLKINPREKAEF